MPFDPNVPQADQDAIARRLLGDDLVNRFGDVIGARPKGFRDALRDFTIAGGSQDGGQKLNALKLQVQERFSEELQKEQEAARLKREEDRRIGKQFLSTIETIQKLPPGHRSSVLKETLDKAQIPYTQATLKMFTDADMLAKLPIPELQRAAADGELSAEAIGTVTGDANASAKFIQAAETRTKTRQQTQNLILGAQKKGLDIQRAKVKLAEEEEIARRGLEIKRKEDQVRRGRSLRRKARQGLRKQAGQESLFGIDLGELDQAVGTVPVESPGTQAAPAEGTTSSGNAFRRLQ